MIAFNLIATVGSGTLVGFVLGLVGGGGSILATPLLLYVVGVGNPHVAIGTSALAVSVNAYVNLIAHARQGHVRWRCAIIFAGAGMIGALVGSSLGLLVDGKQLLLLFGFAMATIGVLMLRPMDAHPNNAQPVDARALTLTAATALLTGIAAGFFGIGGGFLIVPALVFSTGMPMIFAIGSSLLAVGTFGLTTALNYARAGMVDWQLAAVFLAGGVAGGVAGMLLATRLSSSRTALSRIFAVLVLSVAAYVIIRNWP